MTWEIIVIVLIFVFTNVGQTYFTTWRMTSETYLKNAFQKETPLKEIENNLASTLSFQSFNSEIKELKESLDSIKSQMILNAAASSGGYEQLYNLLLRGSTIKIDELIEEQFKNKKSEWQKREQDIINLAQKIEEYGKVIIKK